MEEGEKEVSPPPFVKDWDPALHWKNDLEYDNSTRNLFETNDLQGHSINNEKEPNEFIIENGNSSIGIEDFP